MGAAFAVITFLKSRDKDQKESQKETADRDKEIAELKIRLEIYTNELDELKKRVDNLDMKLMEEIKSLSKKIDDLVIRLLKNDK